MAPPCVRRPLAEGLALCCLIAACGCSAAGYAADADREVAQILSRKQAAVLGSRETGVARPGPEKPEPPPAPEPEAVAPAAPPEIDLEQALATAVRSNRQYQSRRESLYRQGLSYSLTRFNFGPLLSSTVSHVWSDREADFASHRLAGTFRASQILPLGGELSFDSQVGSGWFERGLRSGAFGPGMLDTVVGLNLTQPLLRGGGYEASHEALTQAERDMVYAVRDFELFREDFSIGVAQGFFDLVSQQQTLANEEANLRQAVFDRRKAEALLQVDRSTEVEVYRARRREIEAENRLLDTRARFERARDQFKIQLGLSTADFIEIASLEPSFEPVRFDATSAVAAARHNRLDLQTQRERIQDSERSLRIAENSLLPELNLQVGVGMTGDPDSSFEQALPDRWDASASIMLNIPLQAVSERNSLRSTELALEQARRDYSLLLDQIELEIKNQLRNLRSLEQQIELQRQQIEQERRAVTVTEIRFEAGDLDNRDLLEARQALFSAQNALIQLNVQHFIGRLTLLRDLGLLFVDDEGMWR